MVCRKSPLFALIARGPFMCVRLLLLFLCKTPQFRSLSFVLRVCVRVGGWLVGRVVGRLSYDHSLFLVTDFLSPFQFGLSHHRRNLEIKMFFGNLLSPPTQFGSFLCVLVVKIIVLAFLRMPMCRPNILGH